MIDMFFWKVKKWEPENSLMLAENINLYIEN